MLASTSGETVVNTVILASSGLASASGVKPKPFASRGWSAGTAAVVLAAAAVATVVVAAAVAAAREAPIASRRFNIVDPPVVRPSSAR